MYNVYYNSFEILMTVSLFMTVHRLRSPLTSSMAGFTLTSSSSVATRDSSSELGSPLAAPSVQHSSSKLGSAFGLRSHSSFFILHSSFFILHSSFFILHSSFKKI